MIDIGEGEIKQLETNRETAFDKLKENNYEHYI